eukprot:6190861-Pleurochrysis_carterae.AAC.1
MANAAAPALRRRQRPASLPDHQQPQTHQPDIMFEGNLLNGNLPEGNLLEDNLVPNQDGEQTLASDQEQCEVITLQQQAGNQDELVNHFDLWLCSLVFREWYFHRWTAHRWAPAAVTSFLCVIAMLCSPANAWSRVYTSSVATLAFIAFCLVFLKYAKTEWRQKGTWILVTCFICWRLANEHLLSTPRLHLSPETLVMEYGMDIMRPVIFMITLPLLAMPPSVYCPIILVYSVALLRSSIVAVLTIKAMTSQSALSSTDTSGSFGVQSSNFTTTEVPLAQICSCISVPVALFVVGVANAAFREKMDRHLHTLLQQREQAHRQEEAATRRAAESEARAREAERIAHEQDVQRRNKCVPSIRTFDRPYARIMPLPIRSALSLRPLQINMCEKREHAEVQLLAVEQLYQQQRDAHRMLTSTRLSRCP